MDPIRLGPNQPAARPYRGGAGIRALRGVGSLDEFTPEDFVASTTTVHGSDTVGLTTLDDGRTLREAIAADPIGYLGEEHVERFGADSELLVKLLSTGERLFNHFHPGNDFARGHLGEPRGKTEAWLIVDSGEAASAMVWLGFRREVSREEMTRWFTERDVRAMLGALHPVTVRAGDWVYVPAGVPHSIGAGVTLVELQQPADVSIILEYAPFPGVDAADVLFGLDVDTALDALRLEPVTVSELDALHGSAGEGARVHLLPDAADEFFRAELLSPAPALDLDASFSVLVVLDGDGVLMSEGGTSTVLAKGDVILVPYGAGATTLSGSVRAIRCAPPTP